MSERRPAAVHIDDLEHPVFSSAAGAMLHGMAAAAASCPLDVDAVIGTAMAQTGLRHLGDESIRDRLAVLCWCFREEAGLTPAGRVQAFGLLSSLVANRLLIEDLLARHPEIHDERIARPIIICGQPRTGTTHLHNLLAADPSLRSLPYWESLQPVLPAAERDVDPDPRLARTAQSVGLIDTLMPLFARMHEMTVTHVHEEIQLLAIDGSTQLFETMGVIPTWRDRYLATDQTSSYEYLKTVLKVCQWQRGGGRWVLKSPQHLEQFGVLAQVFPDATVVLTHRDPVPVTLSLCTMLTYTARTRYDPVPVRSITRYWCDRAEGMARACVTDRDVLAPERSIDVTFEEFMADDMAMVERIYDLADHPFTGEAADAMRAFAAGNPRGRHGGIVYDWEQLGIDPHERREALQFYVDRFQVATEPI